MSLDKVDDRMGKSCMQRQSNIELVRIVAILGVILLHYNNPSYGGGLAYAQGLNSYILYFLTSVFVCAVDLFVLISGYFMCKNSKCSLLKPLELLIQVVVFNEAIYFIGVLVGKKTISIKGILGHLIPSNYFVILYVVLYFIHPLLNIIVEKANEKSSFKKIMIVLLLIFSVYPTFVDLLQEILGRNLMGLSSIGMYGSQRGYSIVNFLLMYLVGAYIRNNGIKKSKPLIHLIKIFVLAIILAIWAILSDFIGFGTGTVWSYCNPVVIFLAVEFFMLFSQLNLGQIKLINELSKATFTVFLLHHIFLPYLMIKDFVTGNCLIMLIHIIISTIGIFCICWCVYKVYELLVRPLYNKLSKVIPVLTKNIYKELSE